MLTQWKRDLLSHAVDLPEDDPAAPRVDPLALHDVGGVPGWQFNRIKRSPKNSPEIIPKDFWKRTYV